jgi:hypothetical protein
MAIWLPLVSLALNLMKNAVFAVSLFITASANAESFDERAEIGRKVEAQTEYQPYIKKMYDAIGGQMAEAMRACFKFVAKSEDKPFTLVADVSVDGKVGKIEIRPRTNIANCFAQEFVSANFPIPPNVVGRNKFPVTIDMRIEP